MNRIVLSLLLVLPCIVSAQTTTNAIAGFKLSIPGHGGNGTSHTTYLAPPVTQRIVYEGRATALTGMTITDANATWADGAFTGTNGAHYVEIIQNGPGNSTTSPEVGVWQMITDSTGGVITTAFSLPANLQLPLSYRVRPCWTLSSLIGAPNNTGIKSGDALSADQIILWDGPGFATYYYQSNGIGGTGWRKVGAPTVDAASTPIKPNTAILIKRYQASTVTLIIAGTPKIGQTVQRMVPGYNYVANPYATAMDLSSSGLYTGQESTGLVGGPNAEVADQVLLWNGSHVVAYYFNTTLNDWRKAGDETTPAAATRIEPGTGFIVNRRGSNVFNWLSAQRPLGL